MKKLFTLVVATILLSCLYAQSPEKMSYQGVIRNNDNQLVTSHDVGMRISILQGSPSGTILYQETYIPVPHTNPDGVISIDIGAGVPLTGTFSVIDWANGPYYIKTETDPTGGTNYSISNTSQLLSVPYALYAKISGNGFSGAFNDLTGKPDFSKWDKDTTSDVTVSGNQTIEGRKIFMDTITAGHGVSVNHKHIINLANPVDPQDAATRAYVEALTDQLYEQGILKLADVDENLYHVVKIGSRIWMAENLKTTRYNDRSDITLVSENEAWHNITTGAYGWYDNDEASNKNTYGAIYNWNTIITNKLCPVGWHVPTDDDWALLVAYLGYEDVAGGKLKEAGATHWQDPNYGATNESGFTALPGGYRYYFDGTFREIGEYGYWWTSTEHYGIHGRSIVNGFRLGYNTNHVSFMEGNGFSVRCVKD